MSNTIKRALLIGINYKGSQYELHGCINDVLAIKDILISKYNYLEENILLLTDDTSIKPTNANIIKAWKWLLSKSPVSDFNQKYVALTSNDKSYFFFHYSGHGSQLVDRNGDETDRKDETICPIDFATKGMITDDIIRDKLIGRVPSNGKLVAIIDACHSESSFDLLWTAKVGILGSFTLSRVGNYIPTQGDVMMLSGCRDNQTSADIQINGRDQGALTYALLEVLKSSNYKITCDKLLTDIRNCIKNNRLSLQVPCLSFGKSANISRKFSL